MTGAVRDQVSRILASAIFIDSPRMARFLGFAVEETLNGRGSVQKEKARRLRADYDDEQGAFSFPEESRLFEPR